jgi:tetratricopeptide (TPR) repeat protein
MTPHADVLLRLLVTHEILSPEQANEAFRLHRQAGITLRDAIVRLGWATEDRVTRAIATLDGLVFVDLTPLTIPSTIIESVPESLARQFVVIPVASEGGLLTVAVHDPFDEQTLSRLRTALGHEVRRVFAPREQILDAINRHYKVRAEAPPPTPTPVSAASEDRDSEFELTLDDRGGSSLLEADASPPRKADSDEKIIFETDFEVPALEEKSGSEAVALDEANTSLDSSDFDLALDEKDAAAEDESGSQVVALDEEAADETAATQQAPARKPKGKAKKAPAVAAEEEEEVEAEEEPGFDMGLEGEEELAAEEEIVGEAAELVVSRAKAKSARARARPAVKDNELEVAPVRAGAPQVPRRATVRYYGRMNPEKMFPFLVILSEKTIKKVVQRGISQQAGARFQVQEGSPVEVEPILPGCSCYPPRETLRVSSGETAARFYVVPHVLGRLAHARVVIRQGGEILSEVPLEVCVVKQTMTVVMAVVSFLLPLAAALLQHFGIDLRAGAGDGLFSRVIGLTLGSFSPDVLAGLLLGMTGGLYCYLRPRKRDLFWDIKVMGPSERLEEVRKAYDEGERVEAARLLKELLKDYPRSQPAWLFAAECAYRKKDYRQTLQLYSQALDLGKASAASYSRAAVAAGRIGDNRQALDLLVKAVAELPKSEITGTMWYNMGCYAARLGEFQQAMRYLKRATAAGFTDAQKYHTDPDLAPLRGNREFKRLLACVES